VDAVTLLQCQKCYLLWVDEGKAECPRCRAHWSVPQKPVVVAGFEVEVKAVVLHGAEIGLLDPKVRKGLDTLYLGERCSCGYLTYRICPKHFKQSS
jgi:hypothetical protein